ncbi:hypothetical protein IPN41_01095 [Candidatus Falkowbacteria bacterium]|nr:MAG: hypothetical protein IPN41_01095 [Candidatus Falkowbacteria bacterium]
MNSKNLIALILFAIAVIFSSKPVLSQPSECWKNLVLKPQTVSAGDNSYEIKGQVVYFWDVKYFQKLQHDEVGVHYHFASGKTESWDHLTLYITPDSNLTVYSREVMTTNFVMGLVRCYNVSRAREIIQSRYSDYLKGDIAKDTLNDPIIYMGDEHFPKWDYVSLYEGKVIITYNIETGDTSLEFIGMKPVESEIFTLPTFELIPKE